MTGNAITMALARAERGEPGADAELWELVYADLKRIAAARLARLRPGETLQATALVNEAWLRLGDAGGFEGRAHFFGAAARSMRNILVDEARRKQRLCRNEGRGAEELSPEIAASVGDVDQLDMLALDEALTALSAEYERPARVVMLRYFTGLEIGEIAELLGVNRRTVDRDFLFARSWLRRHIDRGTGNGS